MKEDDSKTKRMGDIFRLLKGRITLAHFVIILFFVLLAVGLGIYASSRTGTLQGTIALSFATAFATAAIVDLAYNYVVMKDVEEMVAMHLMLNKEVQGEILKKEKIDEILDCSLESTVGVDLKQAIKLAIINKVRRYKDIIRLNASLNVVLQSFKDGHDELKNNFYKLEMVSKYQEILNKKRLVFVATDNEEVYQKEYCKTGNDERPYVFLLPAGLEMIIKRMRDIKFFEVLDVKIAGILLHKVNEKSISEDRPLRIIETFEIPDELFKEKEDNLVTIEFSIHSILAKWEHIFFEDIHKAYSNFQILFDYSNTDIANCDVYHSFVSTAEPHIKKMDNGKKILLFTEDWTLPTNMVCFVWCGKNEIPLELYGGE